MERFTNQDFGRSYQDTTERAKGFWESSENNDSPELALQKKKEELRRKLAEKLAEKQMDDIKEKSFLSHKIKNLVKGCEEFTIENFLSFAKNKKWENFFTFLSQEDLVNMTKNKRVFRNKDVLSEFIIVNSDDTFQVVKFK